MKAILLFAVLATSTSASASPKCISQAQFDAKVKKLAADDEAHYRAALKKQKLAPVTLPMQTWTVDRVGPPPDPREITKGGKHLLLAGTAGVSCGQHGDSPFLLARSGDKIFLIEREFESKKLDIAVCAPKTCVQASAAAPQGCGTAPQPTMFAYELPANSSFGGDRTVRLVSYWASAEIVGTSACPPALPPTPVP